MLANDTDVDGGPKSIVSTTDGAHGTVAITGGGSGLTYEPDSGYCNDGEAADTFTYTLNGGSTAQVDVTIACNPGPVAVDDAVTLNEGAAATAIDVLANDTERRRAQVDRLEDQRRPRARSRSPAGAAGSPTQPDSGYCNDGEAADTFTYTLNGGASATVSVRVICVTTVATSPALEPSFDPAIPDYTVEVHRRSARGLRKDRGGDDGGDRWRGRRKKAHFEATVPLQENQEFGFSTVDGGEQRDYHVRCLPSDFPIWEYTALKPAAREFYVVTPTLGAGFSPVRGDLRQTRRAPLVALRYPGPNDAKFVAAGRIAWWGETEGGNRLRDPESER